jgi:hypothetical protein
MGPLTSPHKTTGRGGKEQGLVGWNHMTPSRRYKTRIDRVKHRQDIVTELSSPVSSSRGP